jgi:hypothetical protein
VLTADGFNPNALREYCDSKCGVVLGRGLELLPLQIPGSIDRSNWPVEEAADEG